MLPGYPVVTLLSHGRRLDTYDVYSTDRDCRCVVKILRVDRRREERVREAVILEGTLLRDLAHPHLVRGYEVRTEPAPAMVLETLAGATLGALIDDEPLQVADSAQLGLQLVSVLSYLHRQGWLHLDVKPSNIVVESNKATLIDLSLIGRPGSARPGAGTRGYLAPEQAVGDNLSAASDVWGLGVTLIESLTGEMPHGDEATWDSKRRIRVVHRRAPKPLDRIPSLPARYDELLRGCLERDPADRPALDDIRSYLTEIAETTDPAGHRGG